MRFLSLVLILSYSLFCLSAEDYSPEIINGHFTTKNDPYEKHISGILKSKEILCSAVIISDKYVLTAAHCFQDAQKAKLVFGRDKKHWQIRDISKLIVHPKYDDTAVGITESPANDLLLVEFNGGLPPGFSPAILPEKNWLSLSLKVIVSGYGMDENDEVNALKATEVEVVESVPFEFRTTEKKTGSCEGDSGGPVFFKDPVNESYILVGLVSRGDISCMSYGIYENVFYYLNWIQENWSGR